VTTRIGREEKRGELVFLKDKMFENQINMIE
jgi:hypothetical protein